MIAMATAPLDDALGKEELLQQTDGHPPDAEEILRRLRDKLLEDHRTRIQRRASRADHPDA